jgi:hypothetical protein
MRIGLVLVLPGSRNLFAHYYLWLCFPPHASAVTDLAVTEDRVDSIIGESGSQSPL